MSDEPKPVGVDDQQIIDNAVPAAPLSAEEREQQATLSEIHQQKTAGSKPAMRVKVYSPFHNYFDGPALSLSAVNQTGPFDILPHHHNFISLLSPCDLVLRTDSSGDQKIRIAGGLMHVKADQVIVFLDV